MATMAPPQLIAALFCLLAPAATAQQLLTTSSRRNNNNDNNSSSSSLRPGRLRRGNGNGIDGTTNTRFLSSDTLSSSTYDFGVLEDELMSMSSMSMSSDVAYKKKNSNKNKKQKKPKPANNNKKKKKPTQKPVGKPADRNNSNNNKPTRKPTKKPTTSKPTGKPTKEPTEKPTKKPTNKPTNKAATPPPTAGSPADAPAADADKPTPTTGPTTLQSYSGKRYLPWSSLSSDERQIAKNSLGYTSTTWNQPGTNAIEESEFYSLNKNQKNGAKSLGLKGDTWDCHVNHYEEFWWSHLEEYDVARYFRILGWSKGSWEDGDAAPATEAYYWEWLSAEQKVAAGQLCFFEELWDGYSIEEMELV